MTLWQHVIDGGFSAPYTIASLFDSLQNGPGMNLQPNQKRPSLDEVMAYQNERVIGSFLKTFAMPVDEARDIFEQLKRMLWLTNEMDYDGLHADEYAFSIDHSLQILDEMWHTFILCTKDYQAFCLDTFGYFLHHSPTVESDAEQAARKAEFAGLSEAQAIVKIADQKRWQYTYVFKKLGKDVFIKWYTGYHQTYTARHLLDLRLKMLSTANQ